MASLVNSVNSFTLDVSSAADDKGIWNSSETPREDIKTHACAVISIRSDQPSAPDGLICRWSIDRQNWDFQDTFTLDTSNNGIYTKTINVEHRARYFGLKYINGDVATGNGEFRLQTVHKTMPQSIVVENDVTISGYTFNSNGELKVSGTGGGGGVADTVTVSGHNFNESGELKVTGGTISNVTLSSSETLTVSLESGSKIDVSGLTFGGDLALVEVSCGRIDICNSVLPIGSATSIKQDVMITSLSAIQASVAETEGDTENVKSKLDNLNTKANTRNTHLGDIKTKLDNINTTSSLTNTKTDNLVTSAANRNTKLDNIKEVLDDINTSINIGNDTLTVDGSVNILNKITISGHTFGEDDTLVSAQQVLVYARKDADPTGLRAIRSNDDGTVLVYDGGANTKLDSIKTILDDLSFNSNGALRVNDYHIDTALRENSTALPWFLSGYNSNIIDHDPGEGYSYGISYPVWPDDGIDSYEYSSDQVPITINETMFTDSCAQFITIQSNNTADNYGGAGAHTITITGLDHSWNTIEEDVSMNSSKGTTKRKYFRVNEISVRNVGTYFGSNKGVIKAKGLNSSKLCAVMGEGDGTSKQLVYSVPNNKTLIINSMCFNCHEDITINVCVRESADNYKFMSPVKVIYYTKGNSDVELKEYIRVPSRSDLIVTSVFNKDLSSNSIHGSLSGYLVDVDEYMLTETGYDILVES